MRKFFYILLGFSTFLYSAMPYTFHANAKAKASEVNTNFSFIENKIIKLENNITNISNNVAKTMNNTNNYSGCDDKGVFEYKYSQIQSNIGDIITVGGHKYIIVAMPFEEFGSKDKYYIKYPVELNRDNNTTYYSTSMDFSFVKKGTNCYKDTFDGFPALVHNISYSRTYTHDADDNIFIVKDKSYLFLTIKINQTTVTIYNFNYHPSGNIEQKITVPEKDVDLRDNIDWDKLSINNQFIENIKKLTNYVDIVKIGN